MFVIPVTHSSFPKNDDSLRLKKAIDSYERGKLSSEELILVYDSMLDAIISAQKSAGMERITDGQLGWVDEVNPFFSSSAGSGDMVRYFNTNVLYRKPIVRLPKFGMGGIQLYCDADKMEQSGVNKGKAKVCVTGPYTLSKMCVNETGDPDLAVYLAYHVAELIAMFPSPWFVQINEPAIVFNPQDQILFHNSTLRLASLLDRNFGWEDRLCLSIHYGTIPDCMWGVLGAAGWPGFLHIDLVEGEHSLRSLRDYGWEGKLQLGVLDAKSTKMEDPEVVCNKLSVLSRIPTANKRSTLLTTSCGLEFLPWDVAVQKSNLLTTIATKWNLDE